MLDAGENSGETSGELLHPRIFDEDAAQRGATLAGAGTDRNRRLGDGEIQLGVVEHDHGVLAARLQGEDLFRLVQEIFLKGTADGVGSREEDPVHTRMHGELASGFGPSLYDLENSQRQPGVPPEPGQEVAHRRGHLAGLEHDRVSRRKSRNDVPAGEVGGRTEGAEHREHSARMEAGPRVRRPPDRLGEAHPLGQGEVGLRWQQLGLDSRLPDRLAHLPGDQLCQLLPARSGEVAEAADRGGPGFEAGIPPSREGRAGAANRLIHGVGFPDGKTTELVLGVGRRDAAQEVVHLIELHRAST